MNVSDNIFKELIDKYVHATDDEEYKITLQAIRQALKHCRKAIKFEQLEGAIIFYKFKEFTDDGSTITNVEDKMKMKIFVLNEEMLQNTLFANEAIKNEPQKAREILEKICSPRNYNTLRHYEKFKTHFASDQHHILDVSENDTADYPDSNIFTAQKLSDAIVIPIPVLSSPSILIFLDYAKIKSNYANISGYRDDTELRLYIREIQRRSSEIINYHLTRRLLREFTQQKPSIEEQRNTQQKNHIEDIKDEFELVKKFASNIAHILLPINYTITCKITSSEEKFEVFEWFNNDEICNSQFELSLLDGSYSILFNLPTFWTPYNSHDLTIENGLIHNAPDYQIKKQQIKDELEDLFKLIHLLWKRIQDQQELVLKSVQDYIKNSKYISSGKIDEMILKYKSAASDLENFKEELDNISVAVKNDNEEKETIILNDDSIIFKFKNNAKLVEVSIPYNDDGKTSSVNAGLKALFLIIKKTTKEKKGEISCMSFSDVHSQVMKTSTGQKGKNKTEYDIDDEFNDAGRKNTPIIETNQAQIYQKALDETQFLYGTFLSKINLDYKDFTFEFDFKKIKSKKEEIITALKKSSPKPEFISCICQLKKEITNLLFKQGLFENNETSYSVKSNPLSLVNIKKITLLWYNILDNYNKNILESTNKKTKAVFTTTKEFNQLAKLVNTEESKMGTNTHKALQSAISQIKRTPNSKRLIENLINSNLFSLNQTLSGNNQIKINRNKDVFHYDQSQLSNADKINWVF